MAIEMSSDTAICSRCGKKYSRRKGYFPVSYAILHKGIGYIPVCKDCIDTMYNTYLAQCNNAKDAVRQMCRKLDLYWSESVYEMVSRKSTTRSMMTQYIAKINTVSYAGKSYDDTLSESGTLWSFDEDANSSTDYDDSNTQAGEIIETPDEIIAFWGSGYSDEMSFLEGSVLSLQEMFQPIQSSSQISSSDLNSTAATDEGGAPTKDIGEVSDSREANSEEE